MTESSGKQLLDALQGILLWADINRDCNIFFLCTPRDRLIHAVFLIVIMNQCLFSVSYICRELLWLQKPLNLLGWPQRPL